jgi:type IX secretion system PorP/SprF family membrane protein
MIKIIREVRNTKYEVRKASSYFVLRTSYIINYVRHFFLLLIAFTTTAISSAQDIHFSQFMQSPLNLNPAQTGNFDGAYRFVGNFRRQWSSVTIPYQTFGLSADAKNFLRKKNINAGTSLYYDKTGDSHFSTLQFNLAGSYTIKLNKPATEFLFIGIQSGFTQRRIDYSNLTFDNQFNGFVYDPNIPSVETFENDGRIYLNLNAGINWVKNFEERKSVSAGIALFNLTKPPQSFFGNDQIRLDRRLSFNLTGQGKLTDKFDLLPSILFMAQGTYRELILGTSIKYIMTDNRNHYRNTSNHVYRALYAGFWARTRDAGFVAIGMDYDQWYVGLSYDINFSNLRPASLGRGGFEVSVIYIIRDVLPKRLKYKVCPDFM